MGVAGADSGTVSVQVWPDETVKEGSLTFCPSTLNIPSRIRFFSRERDKTGNSLAPSICSGLSVDEIES